MSQEAFKDQNNYEELEPLELMESVEEAEEVQQDHDLSQLMTSLRTEPLRAELKFLLRTLEEYPSPAILLSPKLFVIWENNHYSELFDHTVRQLPVNLSQDFSQDLDTEEYGAIYSALHSPESQYSYRGRLQAIHHKRLTRVFNVNINPIYLEDENTPVFYQAHFDDVTEEQKTLLQGTFLSLLEASKLKDNDTGKHIQRVGEYSRILAEYLYTHADSDETAAINLEFIENIRFLAQMHDVGKIGTPDDILNKEGALDEQEWEIMQEHTINGAYIMSTYPHPMAREIALFHHEKWDGSGYPYQLSGNMIPLSARIVAVADVYDALRMERSYKKAYGHSETVRTILNDAGTHFDPMIAAAFQKIHGRFRELRHDLSDT